MIVCSCFVVSDHDIKKLAGEGKSFPNLKRQTKLGSNCGSCMIGAKQIFDQARDNANSARKSEGNSKRNRAASGANSQLTAADQIPTATNS